MNLKIKLPGASLPALVCLSASLGLTGWTQVGTWATAPYNGRTANPGALGTSSGATLYQTLATAAGTTHNWAAYLDSADGANSGPYVYIMFLNSSGAQVGPQYSGNYITTPFGWYMSSISATAPATATQVRLCIYAGATVTSNGVYVDDAAYSAVAAGGGSPLAFDANGNLIAAIGSEFHVVNGALTMLGVDFTKGFGGMVVDGNTVPKIHIQAGGVDVGWFGYDSVSGYTGGWVKRLMIGGTGPGNAGIQCDALGNVSIRGNLIVGDVPSATNAGYATNAGSAAIYTGKISVNSITNWSLAVITVSSGVTFVGSNYTVRINVPNFAGGNYALMSTGGMVLSSDSINPQIQIIPSPVNPSITLKSFSDNNYVQMYAGNGGQVTISGGGHTMVISPQHITVDGVVKL
ncbi:MAG: hypothetical protein LAQ69_15240 [Acidobacteriia bacterium]|nr:hypothetical protein [Terriglobia bacterium]